MTEYACPLRVVRTIVIDDGRDQTHHDRIGDCGATLHLRWTYGWPIDPEELTVVDGLQMPGLAYTETWEVVCEAGHTLALSPHEMDVAAAFDPVAVMGALAAQIIDPLVRDLAHASTDEARQLITHHCRSTEPHAQHFYTVDAESYLCEGVPVPPVRSRP